MDPIAYLQAYGGAFVAVAGLLGLVMGSFLNVVVHRLPIMLERGWRAECQRLLGMEEPISAPAQPYNLVVPRSRCPACGTPIGALDNIPLISFVLLRGRCRACGASISPRYPLVEALGGVLTALVAWRLGFGWPALAAMFLTWALIALAFIDLDHQILPDAITLPGLWAGVGLASFGVLTDLQASVIGAMAGYLSLWVVYWGFKLLTGKEGMGHGDFKLLALLGAWLGWQALPQVILLSSLVGALVGIALIVARRHGRGVPIPFGPYLAAGGWVALLWGDAINAAYLRLLVP
jgi:leader peptidase (prepilin peptidase)/N-methyltransferase